MSFEDYEVNEEYAGQFLPPTIQWRRGDLVNQHPGLKNGCWQLPVENFEAIIGNSLPVINVVHGGGVVVESYLFETLHLSILAWKKRWYIMEDGQYNYLSDYQEGARSRLQYYAIVKEIDGAGLVSVSGLNAKHLSQASYQHQQKIVKAAYNITKRKFSQYHFWCPLSAGPKTETAHNQYITPPRLAIDDKVDKELLNRLFVGSEVAELAESLMQEARDWAFSDRKPQAPATSPDYGAEPAGSAPPPPPNFDDSEDEIPF